MTELLLRDVLKEAKKKGQSGLLIWPSLGTWDDLGNELKPGVEDYDTALAMIEKGEEAIIKVKFLGLEMPGIIAVSVEKLSSSKELFDKIALICKQKYYDGPITLIPSNELSEHF